jgi:hypothetical protein
MMRPALRPPWYVAARHRGPLDAPRLRLSTERTLQYAPDRARASHGGFGGNDHQKTIISDLLKLVGQQLLTQRKVGKMFVFTPAQHLRELLNNT